MQLKIADEADNERLIQFFKNFPSEGWVRLQADRHPDFFSIYKLNSDRYLTYLLEDTKTHEVHGAASFVGKEVMLQGQKESVAFACDLRISNHRRAVLQWSKHFLPTLYEAKLALEAKSIFAMINLSEAKALNAFLTPRIKRPEFPVYHYFRQLSGVSVHGRFPWAKNLSENIKIKHFTPAHEEELWNYLFKKNKNKDLSPFESVQHIGEFFNNHDTLDKENFLIAYDKQDRIIGCTLPWSPRQFVELIPLSYDSRAQNFRQFLKFADTVGWARKLSQPALNTKFSFLKKYLGIKSQILPTMARNPDSLNIKYLNYHAADSHYTHESLLDAAYFNCERGEFLYYMRDEGEIHLKCPRFWIGSEVKYGVFYLGQPNERLPSFLSQKARRIVSVDHPLLG